MMLVVLNRAACLQVVGGSGSRRQRCSASHRRCVPVMYTMAVHCWLHLDEMKAVKMIVTAAHSNRSPSWCTAADCRRSKHVSRQLHSI